MARTIHLTIAGGSLPIDDDSLGLGWSANTLAWRDQVVAYGGTVSDRAMGIRNYFEHKERLAGTWPLTDDYFLHFGENEPQALVSLKRHLLGVVYNAPAFETVFALDGMAQYADTGFVPSVHAAAMTTTNQRLGSKELTNIDSDTPSIGARNNSGSRQELRPRNRGNLLASFGESATASYDLPVRDSSRFCEASRNGTTVIEAAWDGVRLADATGRNMAALLTSRSYYVGCRNNAGVPERFRPSTPFVEVVGAQLLTDQQRASQRDNVEALAVALGLDE